MWWWQQQRKTTRKEVGHFISDELLDDAQWSQQDGSMKWSLISLQPPLQHLYLTTAALINYQPLFSIIDLIGFSWFQEEIPNMICIWNKKEEGHQENTVTSASPHTFGCRVNYKRKWCVWQDFTINRLPACHLLHLIFCFLQRQIKYLVLLTRSSVKTFCPVSFFCLRL